ncbi:MAG TPA: hypothetical protein VEA59_03500, partial [Patescibacteria group bacterium]|nr:hypothetical protein [Patescibacteria group bacterium]
MPIEQNKKPGSSLEYTFQEKNEAAKLDYPSDEAKQKIADFVKSFAGEPEDISLSEISRRWLTFLYENTKGSDGDSAARFLINMELDHFIEQNREQLNLPFRVSQYLHQATSYEIKDMPEEAVVAVWTEMYKNAPDTPRAWFLESSLMPGWTGGLEGQPQDDKRVFKLQELELTLPEHERRLCQDPTVFASKDPGLYVARAMEIFERTLFAPAEEDDLYRLTEGINNYFSQIALAAGAGKNIQPMVASLGFATAKFSPLLGPEQQKYITQAIAKLPEASRLVIEKEREQNQGRELPLEFKDFIKKKLEQLQLTQLRISYKKTSPQERKELFKTGTQEARALVGAYDNLSSKAISMLATAFTYQAWARGERNTEQLWKGIMQEMCNVKSNGEVGHIAAMARNEVTLISMPDLQFEIWTELGKHAKLSGDEGEELITYAGRGDYIEGHTKFLEVNLQCNEEFRSKYSELLRSNKPAVKQTAWHFLLSAVLKNQELDAKLIQLVNEFNLKQGFVSFINKYSAARGSLTRYCIDELCHLPFNEFSRDCIRSLSQIDAIQNFKDLEYALDKLGQSHNLAGIEAFSGQYVYNRDRSANPVHGLRDFQKALEIINAARKKYGADPIPAGLPRPDTRWIDADFAGIDRWEARTTNPPWEVPSFEPALISEIQAWLERQFLSPQWKNTKEAKLTIDTFLNELKKNYPTATADENLLAFQLFFQAYKLDVGKNNYSAARVYEFLQAFELTGELSDEMQKYCLVQAGNTKPNTQVHELITRILSGNQGTNETDYQSYIDTVLKLQRYAGELSFADNSAMSVRPDFFYKETPKAASFLLDRYLRTYS